MDHTTIERERLIDRYLLAQLNEDEAARFEEHYLGCAQCLDELEAAEQLQLGLKQAAAEDVAKVTATLSLWSRLARWPQQRPALVLAALALLLLLPAALGWQLRQLQGELSQTRSQLESAQAPQAGTLITYLDAERSAPEAGSAPTQRIRLPAEPGWIVLAAQLDAAVSQVSAELRAPDGTVIWQASGLTADALGNLTVSVHSSQLQAGDYQLQLSIGKSIGGAEPATRSYSCRILPRE